MIVRMREMINTTEQEFVKEVLYFLQIARPRKLLFDHLPKCGGMSINRYLQRNYLKRKTFLIKGSDPATSANEFISFPQHKRYDFDLVTGHLAHQLFNYVSPDILKATIFRDPVDRIISHYYYAKANPRHYLYPLIHKFNMSLEDYATSNISSELRNSYTTHYTGLTAEDAEKDPESSISKAFEIVMGNYNVIGFLDGISSFTDKLFIKADLRYKYNNKKFNVTLGRPAIDEITISTRRKIEQVNYLDLILYKEIKRAVEKVDE